MSYPPGQTTKLRTPRGGVVAPPAALTGIPMAWVGRSLSAPPLGVRGPVSIGIPEARSAGVSGSEGAEPPFWGTGAAGAPRLDTQGITLPFTPPSSATFRPVRMSLNAWKHSVAQELANLARFALPKGKMRRGWRRKATDFLRCGRRVEGLACACGYVLGTSGVLIATCGLRVCPMCARRRANVVRERLGRAWANGARPRDMSLYLITLTLRFDRSDPDDVSVEGIRRRRDVVLDGWKYVWRRHLKARGRAAVRAVEVSPSGMVHVHVLYHGRRPDARTVRDAWMSRVGNSPQVDVKYLTNPAQGIREVAKYVTKGASPANPNLLGGGLGEFTDPRLAARIELAFAGDRLVECYGAWRGLDPDADDDVEEETAACCPRCASTDKWHVAFFSLKEWLTICGRTWKPRMSRSGIRPPPELSRNRQHQTQPKE